MNNEKISKIKSKKKLIVSILDTLPTSLTYAFVYCPCFNFSFKCT